MEVKELINFSHGKQIWRLLLSPNNKLLIEERGEEKEVFFNCIDLNSAKYIFKNFQLEEKFWIGIEAFTDEMIFFHKYLRPDMPTHSGVIAFDLSSKKIIWENKELKFHYYYENKLFCYQQKFDGRKFYSLNPLTGEVFDDLEENNFLLNEIKEKINQASENSGYLFPEVTHPLNGENYFISARKILAEYNVVGNIEFILRDNYLFFSFHYSKANSGFNNHFFIIEINFGKVIFQSELNKNISTLLFDSFFIKDDFLFLIKGKTEVSIYKIK